MLYSLVSMEITTVRHVESFKRRNMESKLFLRLFMSWQLDELRFDCDGLGPNTGNTEKYELFQIQKYELIIY